MLRQPDNHLDPLVLAEAAMVVYAPQRAVTRIAGSQQGCDMFGVLNLDKPIGWTSRDAVNRVARAIRPTKAGHAGTLDPLATGVLLVCVGPATKLIEPIHRMPKQYLATFLLGRRSASDDLETDVEIDPDAPRPPKGMVEAMLSNFVGRIEQTPPAYSAVKLRGKRAYKMARQGIEVQPPPRSVRVDSLSIVRYEYPELELYVQCG
ncbi:MAG: tRNA pseudouridine(55) synthase TruB, partial [Planctomycetota bacterium]